MRNMCLCLRGAYLQNGLGTWNWRKAMTSKFWIKEENTVILGKDLLSSGCVLRVDNRDLSPYHLDTVTGEGGHIRSGHWSLFSLRKVYISLFIFSMKYCLVELDWTSTDILKHKRIIFYGIFYLVRNSITFIFFMERDWQHKNLKPSCF